MAAGLNAAISPSSIAPRSDSFLREMRHTRSAAAMSASIGISLSSIRYAPLFTPRPKSRRSAAGNQSSSMYSGG